MKRDILNYLGNKIGELELPDGTSEEAWSKALSPYLVAPPTTEEMAASSLKFTIKERKVWAEEMMERFKQRNISAGINAPQSLWLHHRMRSLEINFMGIPMTQDILNMAVSGDIETATLALLYSTPDDGSQPFHWYTASTRQWLIDEMKGYLGWA